MTFPTYVAENEAVRNPHIVEILDQLNGVTSEPLTFAGSLGISGTLTLSAGGLIIAHISTPPAPGSSKSIIYPKSNGLWYMRSGAAGAEMQVPVGVIALQGDLIYADSPVSFSRRQLGDVNSFLISNGTLPVYADNPIVLPLDPPTANALTRDSFAKAWAFLSWSAGAPVAVNDYNVAGYVDHGTGDVTILWDTDFAGINNCVVGTAWSSTGAPLQTAMVSQAASGARFYVFNTTTGALVDPSGLHVVAFGAQ